MSQSPNKSIKIEQKDDEVEGPKNAAKPKSVEENKDEQTTSRAAVPQVTPQEQPQKVDCAVNAYGWAMPIPNGVDKINFTQFYCQIPVKQQPWEAGATRMLEEGKCPWRESFHLTDEERAPYRGGAACRVLLVGFALTDLEPEHRRPSPSVGFNWGGLKYNRLNQDGFWTETPTMIPDLQAKKAVMVVTKVDYQQPLGLNFWALLRPGNENSDLCQLYRVTKEECFYLPQFRVFDESTDKGSIGRLLSWNKSVRRAAICSEEVAVCPTFSIPQRTAGRAEPENGGEKDAGGQSL
ncbi:hypothetical protein N657DRAFT_646959 [Parathielavia appendiculata]|uniref:Uncharacterized protein n=1 Tax=Parathielavia appendiculata TaxID=2587402 RepID=A0AAN6TWZ3_9PEZI|nr:hypothetical protein N657DRAFT_646959 [Parathielavia appendiculata]